MSVLRLSALAPLLTILLFSSSLITKTPGCDAKIQRNMNIRPNNKRKYDADNSPKPENKKPKIHDYPSQEEANSPSNSSLKSSSGTYSTTLDGPVKVKLRGLAIQRTLCLVEYVVGGTESSNQGGCTAKEAALLTQLMQLSEMLPIIDDCLQRILMDIFRSPDYASEDAWNKASGGVMLLEEGLKILTEAKNLLYNDGFKS